LAQAPGGWSRLGPRPKPLATAAGGRTVEQEALQDRHVRPPAGAPGRELPEQFTIRLHKGAGETLGASLGKLPTGAVLYCVEEGCVLDRWNKENPDAAMQPGFVIEQVNGVSGYWPLMEELRREGPLELRVSTVSPQSAGPNWLEDITAMGRKIEQSNDKSPFMVWLSSEASQNEKALTAFPSVVARAAGLDKCAICLEDFVPDEMLTELPCKHAFHPLCAARWLTQNASGCVSKRQSCPLCCRKMVKTRDGVAAVDRRSSE